MKRARVAWLALLLTLLSCESLSSVAQASVYNLSSLGISRSSPRGSDYGYWGPPFVVTSWGTSVDKYVCPPGQQMSGWVVVAEDQQSERNWTDWASDYGQAFYVHVTYFGRWLKPPPLHLRVAASCTNNPVEYPYQPSLSNYPWGDFQGYWDDVLKRGSPNADDYAGLVKRAFCWSAAYRCLQQSRAPKDTRRLPLHNGTDAFSLRFKNPSLALPPAVRLAQPVGCRVRRARVLVQQRSGSLRLVLDCRGLKRGAAAQVRIAKPLRRTFRLHRGNGSIRVRLAKPRGTAEPLSYLEYGPARKSCNSIRSRLHDGSRTFELRVNARCGPAAGNAVARLYIGGLLR